MSRTIVPAITLLILLQGATHALATMEPSMNPQNPTQTQVSTTQDTVFWCTHALDNVFKDSPTPTGDIGTLHLAAARNQTVGGQIVIRAGATPARIERIWCTGLRNEEGTASIGEANFQWALVEYHRVEKNSTATPTTELVRTAPADFPDALIPATPTVVPPGTCQPIWVQFRVPSSARPGLYVGMIRGVVANDELQVPVRLTVYDFSLPSSTSLFVTVWMNVESLAKHQNVPLYSEAWWALLDRVAALMAQHHQNVIITPWTLIRADRDAAGKPVLDFERFDRWVRVFFAHGFKRIEISHIGGREHGQWEDKNFVAYDMACQDPQKPRLTIEEWLPILEAHLKERGWLERSMIHVADEPIEVNLASWKELSNRVRKAAPQLRRIDAVHVPDLTNALEVWVPQLNYLEQWLPRFKKAQEQGVELWFYTAWVPQGRYPNRLMDYPLIKTRMLHWLNYTSGTTGYLHWGWNYWDVPFDQFAPGDNWIVWPGTNTPRSSLRYEAMREGIEDHEYLVLLEEAARSAARRVGAKDFDARQFALTYAHAVAPSFQDYTRKPQTLYAVREAVARSIETLRLRIPVAVLARQVGAEAEFRGFAPPGAIVSIGDAQSAAGEDGTFLLAVPTVQKQMELHIQLHNDTQTITVPVVG